MIGVIAKPQQTESEIQDNIDFVLMNGSSHQQLSSNKTWFERMIRIAHNGVE